MSGINCNLTTKYNLSFKTGYFFFGSSSETKHSILNRNFPLHHKDSWTYWQSLPSWPLYDQKWRRCSVPVGACRITLRCPLRARVGSDSFCASLSLMSFWYVLQTRCSFVVNWLSNSLSDKFFHLWLVKKVKRTCFPSKELDHKAAKGNFQP